MNKLIVLLFAVVLCSSANAQDFDLSNIMQGGFSGVSSAEYDEAFDELDSDKNGFLSEEELLKFQQNGLGQAEEPIRFLTLMKTGKWVKMSIWLFSKNNRRKTFPKPIWRKFLKIWMLIKTAICRQKNLKNIALNIWKRKIVKFLS